LLARERAAVAAALNLVDDARPGRRDEALALLDALEREAPFPGAPRVGLTGAPGAGKSTLLDALVRELRRRERTVGIVAVDPSSARSGGALLGDRVRVRSQAGDAGVFFRSMAARDRLGGLADATRASVIILGAVFDVVLVETVGVGQSESDVARLADTLVYVAQPGAGDLLQFMKAGILELPDIFAVNKADLGAVARRTASELEAGLGLGEREATGWTPPVVLVSARDGVGIRELVQAIEAHRAHLVSAGALAPHRRRGSDAFVLETLERRYGSYGIERLGGRPGLEKRLREGPGASPFARILGLGREIEEALAKPRT
jgi:LAO/AO transport system kinase